MSEQNIDAIKLNVASSVDTKGLDALVTSLKSLKTGTANVKELTSELTKLQTALKKVGTSSVDVKTGVEASGDSAEKSAKSFDTFAKKTGLAAIKLTALVVVLRKFATLISNGILESMNYTETLNLFTVSMGKYADSAKKYAEYAGEALGIDPAEFMRNQAMFNTVIKGFGVGADAAAYMSQNVTQLAYDMASLDNITIEEAMQKLNSAIAGELEPVRRVGYDLSQNRLTQEAQDPSNYANMTFSINQETGALVANTEAYENNSNAVIANYNDMTQAEKVQLRYIALMKQVPWTQQDLARSLNDPANQLRIFKAQLVQTSRALGNVFIPVLNQVLPYLQAGAMMLKEWLNYLAALAGYELPDMSDRAWIDSDVTDAYDDIADDMGRAANNAKKLKDYMIGIDELNVLRPDDGNGGGSGISSVYSSGLNFNLPGYDFFGEGIKNQAKEIKENLEQIFNDHSLWDIMIRGGMTLGSKFWEGVFGASPEEFGRAIVNNGDYGKSPASILGKIFTMGSGEVAKNYIFGGLTPEEFAEKMMIMGDADKSPLEMIGKFFSMGWETEVNNPFASPAHSGGGGSAGKAWFEGFVSAIKKNGGKLGDAFDVIVEKNKDNIYYNGVNVAETFSNAISSTSDAFDDVADNIKDRLSLGFTSDSAWYINIGNSIGAFVQNGLAARSTDLYREALKLHDTAIRGLSNDGHYGEFSNVGHAVVDAFNTGLRGERNAVFNTSHGIYDTTVSGISNNGHYGEFTNIGHWIGYSVNQGINDRGGEARNAGANLYNNAANGASNNGNYGIFHAIGENISRGMAEGIQSSGSLRSVRDSVTNASNTVKETLQNIFKIHSPSLWAEDMGNYLIEGFNIGISEEEGETLKVMDSWARTVTDSMSNIALNPGNFALPAINQEVAASVQATADSSFGNIAVGIYEAVANALSSEDRTREFKIMLDGRELYSSMEAEGRARGYQMSNNGFGG
jgi:hypothetical protein